MTIYGTHPDAAGVRWWSTFESLWTHVTLFDRARGNLRVRQVRALTLDDPALVEAAERFALQVR